MWHVRQRLATSQQNTTYWQILAAKGDTGAGAVAFTCRNSTGVPIQAFRVVYISGSTGNEPNITLAQGNNDPNSSKTFGVTPLVINNNSNGAVVHNGEIDNLDTSGFYGRKSFMVISDYSWIGHNHSTTSS
jgi:hypothetical protein